MVEFRNELRNEQRDQSTLICEVRLLFALRLPVG
ncbi:MAG: hypothetical protein JWN98_623 [Abditibacteriota bacterium]|nr:hypothetical protein [Abditibacteriota bacterium]